MIDEFPTVSERRAWLRRFDARIAGDLDRLCDLVEREVAKPAIETVISELLPLRASIRWHHQQLEGLLRSRSVAGRPWWLLGQRHGTTRVPVGDVAIIATWNYPIQLLGIQLVQALAAGNRVWVKPSEHAPQTQARLVELAWAAGVSPDRLHMVEAEREAGPRLLASRRFDHIVFTGSTEVGRAVAAVAAESLTPTTLELSGRDSAIVLGDADPRLAARSIWQAVSMNGGQTCMAPRRALVDRKVHRAFLDTLAPLAAAARPRRLIDAAAANRVRQRVHETLARGGRLAAGVPDDAERLGESWVRPTAVAHVDADAPLVVGDHFGPALAVVEVGSLEETLAVHERCEQHLATSVFTRRPQALAPIVPRLRAATVTVNDCLVPTAHPAVSIGGRHLSGWGVSRGTEGLRTLTREVHLSTTSLRVRVPAETPTGRPAAWLRRLAARGGSGAATPATSQAGSVRSSATGSPSSASAPSRPPRDRSGVST
jgi:acyl-CoA reductase-like NAD-dependent aldehyde dehydrogenase